MGTPETMESLLKHFRGAHKKQPLRFVEECIVGYLLKWLLDRYEIFSKS